MAEMMLVYIVFMSKLEKSILSLRHFYFQLLDNCHNMLSFVSTRNFAKSFQEIVIVNVLFYDLKGTP